MLATLATLMAVTLVAVEAAQGEELPPSDDPSTPGIECPPNPDDPAAPPVVVADPDDCPNWAAESTDEGSSETTTEPEPEPEPAPSPGAEAPAPDSPDDPAPAKQPVPGQPDTAGIAAAAAGGPGNAGTGEGGGRDPNRRPGGIAPADGSEGDRDPVERDEESGGTRAHEPPEPKEPLISEPAFTPRPVGSPIPSFLLPVFRDCGKQYGIPWHILAAINQVETGFGANLNVSSAGAIGWMQFLPSSWALYGVDANDNGKRDPYDPEDAICAAANYLRAAGAHTDMRTAIFAYNHAGWYVELVMGLARQYARIDLLDDPLPRAKRLDRKFAHALERIAAKHAVDWELMLAVLRADGHNGSEPATRAELDALAEQVSAAQRRAVAGELGELVRALYGDRPVFERKVMVLARYNDAVGLTALVNGLYAVSDRLERRVLRSERIEIYDGGRHDVRAGFIDVRVLTLLLYLAERYDEITVTSLFSGHSYYARPGVPSAHAFGRAVDIAAINGTPVLGNQKPGGLVERVVTDTLLLPKSHRPAQLISLFQLGGPSFAAGDHADHIHVGY